MSATADETVEFLQPGKNERMSATKKCTKLCFHFKNVIRLTKYKNNS